jgi:hypothetical protein
MMANKEREAAQRIIDTPDISFDGVAVQSVESADAKLVAAAYLVEHPADDDELINSTWIESVGLQFDLTDHPYAYCHNGQWQIWWSLSLWLRDVNTRGDVRRLCAALGIEMKQTVAA